ncbi:MAG: hypothetical protein ABII75_03030 [Candidatus Omnitrophota bacterium]
MKDFSLTHELTGANISIARRILFTLGIIILVRLGYFLLVPGIDSGVFYKLLLSLSPEEPKKWLNVVILLHISKFRNFSLFSLGIMPYVNACIIVQIIAFLLPQFNRKIFCMSSGRRYLRRIALMVTIALSIMYAYSIALQAEKLEQISNFKLIHQAGPLFQLLCVISMTAAASLFIVFSGLIEKFGIGNGVGVIFVSEVIMRIIFSFDQLFIFYARNRTQIKQVFLFQIILIVFIYLVWRLTVFSKKIELISENQDKFIMHIRPSWSGVWPLIIVEVVLSVFSITLNDSIFWAIPLIIILSSLLYLKIVYQPRWFYELILAHGYRAAGFTNKRIADVLNHYSVSCAILSGVLFSLIYYLPLLMPLVLNIPFVSTAIFGAFGLIVLIGMAENMKEQSAFYKIIQSHPKKSWSLLFVYSDESQAQIQKAYLNSHNICAQVKPSHFIWGMPIRTAVSGYYLYAPTEEKLKAENMLKDLMDCWRQKEI